MPHDQRIFLFLQGPHGPFFKQLARMLRQSGARVWRVGFNAGDAAFWGRDQGYVPFQDPPADWAATLRKLLSDKGITDLVLYGDTRPVHAEAVAQAKAAGVTIHIFEEGYMRPYWVTYERGGSNGHSRLMDFTVASMEARLARSENDMQTPPAHWGDMRQHIFYGALYHWFVLFRNKAYPHFQTHRAQSVLREALNYSRRLVLMPFLAQHRRWATRRIKAGGYPYHLVLLQLEHDASFLAHSPFADNAEFLRVVIGGFAKGAPPHHHLVFKAHPLESGQSPLHRLIRDAAADHKIADRVHYVRGGKLAALLDHASSAVTVNSTAGQQVLWRGLPLKVFGAAVYDKPPFVSDQSLPDFFAAPKLPDARAYRSYRRFLLSTSQVPGGFYSSAGRRQLRRHLVDMMLAENDPYDALPRHGDDRTPKLKVVS
ncbi:capsule biosynthesis protein [Yoonia sp. SS1-5]|uniref:Capsule biosynthesis protein n=1 Tax=Yoonia rhodophyticola TaxID=3137370 RepID=A0ABZ3JC08_9RHOB